MYTKIRHFIWISPIFFPWIFILFPEQVSIHFTATFHSSEIFHPSFFPSSFLRKLFAEQNEYHSEIFAFFFELSRSYPLSWEVNILVHKNAQKIVRAEEGREEGRRWKERNVRNELFLKCVLVITKGKQESERSYELEWDENDLEMEEG